MQNRAARFVTGNYNYETGSMTGILGQLKWESLKKRRKDNRLILLYKGLKGKASVPTDDLIPKTRRCRNQHSMVFQTPIAITIETYILAPRYLVLQEELESVQNRAARFVTGNYNYETGSMTGILGQLKWESLKKRRKDNRLILLYKGLKGKASVPTDDLIPKTRRCRNQHSMVFQTPIANTDIYKGSFFPQTIRDWNALPDSLISSAEDAEDCVAKFTSLVRVRD